MHASPLTIATPLDDVVARLLAGSPRVIGLGVYIWNVERTTELVRRLRDAGCEVQVAMTAAAQRFIGAQTFQDRKSVV